MVQSLVNVASDASQPTESLSPLQVAQRIEVQAPISRDQFLEQIHSANVARGATASALASST